MERNVINQLIEWKNKKNRKPLILNGARQVGKTYIVQESFVKSLRTFIGKHPTLKGLRLSMKSF